MTQLILTNLLMISVGAVLYVVAQSLPRLDGEDVKKVETTTVIDRWISSGIPEKLDTFMNATMNKLFRKTRVVLMRVDNYLTLQLKKINTENNAPAANSKIDFKEITIEESALKNKNGDIDV